jgi:hypothetical protein
VRKEYLRTAIDDDLGKDIAVKETRAWDVPSSGQQLK